MAPNENHNKNPSNPYRMEFPPNQSNPQHVGSGSFHYPPPYPFNQGYPPNQGYSQMYPPSSAMNQQSGYIPPIMPNHQGYPPNPTNQMYPPYQGYPPNATNKMHPPNFTKPSLNPNHFGLKPSFPKPKFPQNAGKSTSSEEEESEEESEQASIISEEEEEDSSSSSSDVRPLSRIPAKGNEGKKAAIAKSHGDTIKAMLDRTDAIIMKELELQLAKEDNKKLLQKKELEVQLAKEETKRFLKRNELLKTLLGKAKLTPAEEAAKEGLLKMVCRRAVKFEPLVL